MDWVISMNKIKQTYWKLRRFVTSLLLPVDKNRTGQCNNCGGCCVYYPKCYFLRFEEQTKRYRCAVHKFRYLQCRKYPRTKREQVHQPCGYRFDEQPDTDKLNLIEARKH